MMMGAFSKQKAVGSVPALAGAASGGGLADMLTSLVGRDRDGSIVDDLSGMIGRALGRS
jgi:hypothetical protein